MKIGVVSQKAFFFAVVSLLFLYFIPCALPWGGHAHNLINWYAVDNLPSEMIADGSGNAFGDNRAFLRDHSSDPDRQKAYDEYESPRHWCDIDLLIETYPPPFDTVPRDLDTYIGIFGRENGVVQWEGIRDHYESLVELMRARNWYMAYQRAAELGHYIADATCPLHCTENYNGQLSADPRNIGIHSRYESEMIDRFISSIAANPGSASRVEDRVELGFDVVSVSWCLVDDIMAADSEVQDINGDYNFDETYYQLLFDRVGQGAQNQLNLAAGRLADLWYTAWDDAGRPSFTQSSIKVNFQPIGSSAPAGWGVDGGHTYGPFGTYGWQ